MTLRQKHFSYIFMFLLHTLTYFLLTVTFLAIANGDLPQNIFAIISVCCELVFALLIESSYISILRGSRVRKAFTIFFMWMLLTTLVGLLGDVFSWGIGFSHFLIAPLLTECGYVVSRLAAFPLVVLYSTYLISYVDDDPEELKRYAWLVGGLSANGALLVLISIITSVDALYPWSLRDHPWVYFFFLCLPISVNIAIILSFRKRLSNRRALSFLVYEILVIATVVFDTLMQDITVAYIAVAYALLQIYISVQIEHEKEQEEALVQQRIAIMLSQIQPHFLYNVLTGIRSLCRSDAEKAEDALTDFTIYLRGNLSSLKSTECIPFLQELDHVQHYVKLEKMRFGRSLRVKFNISATQFLLPPLSVEPIVENAIRHGVMLKKNGGTVEISAEETEMEFIILVSDNGVGFDISTLDSLGSSHIGLSNVRERIGTMCSGYMTISSTPGIGTDVALHIPKAIGGHV